MCFQYYFTVHLYPWVIVHLITTSINQSYVNSYRSCIFKHTIWMKISVLPYIPQEVMWWSLHSYNSISYDVIKHNFINRQFCNTDSLVQIDFPKWNSIIIQTGAFIQCSITHKKFSSHSNVIDDARYDPKNRDREIDGLVQERSNSSALAMELRLSWTNPSEYKWIWHINLARCSNINSARCSLCWPSMRQRKSTNTLQSVFRIANTLISLRSSASFSPIDIYKMFVSYSIIPQWLTRLLCFGFVPLTRSVQIGIIFASRKSCNKQLWGTMGFPWTVSIRQKLLSDKMIQIYPYLLKDQFAPSE